MPFQFSVIYIYIYMRFLSPSLYLIQAAVSVQATYSFHWYGLCVITCQWCQGYSLHPYSQSAEEVAGCAARLPRWHGTWWGRHWACCWLAQWPPSPPPPPPVHTAPHKGDSGPACTSLLLCLQWHKAYNAWWLINSYLSLVCAVIHCQKHCIISAI